MVHYKRKHVQPVQQPPFLHDETEVWGIEQTGEVFTEYDNFLHRIDFYNQRKFTCEITGHSGLTFFEALNSELHGSHDVETNFPENLREHVLRKVQFSSTGRLDDLVNEVYNHFRRDFFPGEQVVAISASGTRFDGTIREKVSFPATHDSDGNVMRPAISNYFIRLHGEFDEHGQECESFFDDNHITRDRKLFSKLLLRSFLKHSITRESHRDAVWTVKENIALEYKIPTELPLHLQPHVIAEQKKLLAQQKKISANGGSAYIVMGPNGSPHLAMRPGPKEKAAVQLSFSMGRQEPQFIPYQQGMQGGLPGQPGLPAQYAMQQHPSQFQEYSPWQPQPTQMPPPPQKPPPPKYPIDDLELPPKNNGLQRPALKFVAKPRCQERKVNGTNGHANGETNGELHCDAPEVSMESVGLMLEIWNTLNVHEDVFILDSFTFDDFLDAMRFVSGEIECELFAEMHCAVLKQLVDEEGKLLIELPEIEEDDEDEEDEDESAETTPEPEPEPELRRTTRGSLRKSEAEALKRERSPSIDPNLPTHRAVEMLANDSWIDRLKVRDFRSGGWQFIMVGILRQLALNERHTERCEAILRELAPLNMPPNQETVRTQYAWMDVNLKVRALQIICMLAVTTKAVREYLEQCSEDMTEMRKTKIEWQRTRKPLVEELRDLDEQRKALILEEQPPSTETNGTAGDTAQEVQDALEVSEVADIINDSSAASLNDEEDESEGEVTTRALRRGQERKRKREEISARQEKVAKEKAAAKAAQPKISAKMKKILRDIEKKKEKIKECEDKIAEMDSDLREANCQRTKLLGKDRFSNRYWWFEKNGMPFSGMPNSSTAHHGYANGRIWVQGPDEMEREGFLELRDDEMASYKEAFGVTIQERRDLEEGLTQLSTAREWGYLDDPKCVDTLIGWLDERGKREKDLRKELHLWKDTITTYMARLQDFLGEAEAKTADGDEQHQMQLQPTRVSTRTKTYVDADASRHHQSLAWRNSRGKEELGHIHSEPPRAKGRKKAVAEQKKPPVGKSGKPLTRQGR